MNKTIIFQKYPIVIRLLHWFMAVVIFVLIIAGWYMSQLPEDAPNKFSWYAWHKSFGVLVLFLWPLRVLIKAISRTPPYYGLPDGSTRLAAIVHMLMYALLLLIPVSGYLMSISSGHQVKFFGLRLPDLVKENEMLADVTHMLHEYLPWILLVFVGVHVAAVVRHHIHDGVNMLRRML